MALKVKKHGPVTVFRMGRSFGSKVVYWVNCFEIGGTLVDTGAAHTGRELAGALSGIDIKTIVNTHKHEDHIGNNAAVSAMSGAGILSHEKALATLENPGLLKLRFYQRQVWGAPRPSSGSTVGNSVAAGRFTLNVIPTPGHCPDHICLLEKNEGFLFSGDLFCGRKFKYLRAEEDFDTICSSLEKLYTLDFEVLFCSLFGIVTGGKEALGAKIDYMKDLRGKILSSHQAGASRDEISKKLMGTEGAMRFITGGHYSLRNTVDSVIDGRPRVNETETATHKSVE